MELRFFQKGFNYSQDGPGNRLVYHLQGCNMRCAWCSNPEGMFQTGAQTVRAELADIVQECLSCAVLFFDGGGVTLTGGEPTLQFDAVRQLFQILKQHNIHTAIETNATHSRLPELFAHLDVLMMDFKHYDSQKLKIAAGVGNETIVDNFAAACLAHQKTLVRIPLIGGFNAAAEDARQFAAFFSNYDTAKVQFEFLPYHEYGRDKWAKCHMEYRMADAFVPPETPRQFADIFAQAGLQAIHT